MSLEYTALSCCCSSWNAAVGTAGTDYAVSSQGAYDACDTSMPPLPDFLTFSDVMAPPPTAGTFQQML